MHGIRKQSVDLFFQTVIIIKLHLCYGDSSVCRCPSHGKVYLYPICLKWLGILKFIIYFAVHTLLLCKMAVYHFLIAVFIPIFCLGISICILLLLIRYYHQPVHLIALIKGNDRRRLSGIVSACIPGCQTPGGGIIIVCHCCICLRF